MTRKLTLPHPNHYKFELCKSKVELLQEFMENIFPA